jgi:hypothetical protein
MGVYLYARTQWCGVRDDFLRLNSPLPAVVRGYRQLDPVTRRGLTSCRYSGISSLTARLGGALKATDRMADAGGRPSFFVCQPGTNRVNSVED